MSSHQRLRAPHECEGVVSRCKGVMSTWSDGKARDEIMDETECTRSDGWLKGGEALSAAACQRPAGDEKSCMKASCLLARRHALPRKLKLCIEIEALLLTESLSLPQRGLNEIKAGWPESSRQKAPRG